MTETQSHDIKNTVVATGSGLAGGTAAMVKTGLFTMITIDVSHLAEVGIYSGVSALIGYVIKLGIDWTIKKLKK